MAEEDDFDLDIDIYGDDRPPTPPPAPELKPEPAATPIASKNSGGGDGALVAKKDGGVSAQAGGSHAPVPQAQGGPSDTTDHGQQPQDHDMEQPPDEREVDDDATTALKLGELEWWTTEEDIRGWTNAAGAEGELVELTFNEHKINGKSKGEVFLVFNSAQAATAVRRHILQSGKIPKKVTAAFAQPDYNPYKNLKETASKPAHAAPGDHANGQRGGYGHNQGGYRGRGGYSRGNFGPRGGFNNGYGMNNMYDQSYSGRGGFPNRGGRGGMMAPMGMMNNMMGNMMGMGMMGMPMGNMGFGGYNQGQFGQGQQGQYDAGNPHGAKRARPDGQ